MNGNQAVETLTKISYCYPKHLLHREQDEKFTFSRECDKLKHVEGELAMQLDFCW